MQNKYLDHSKTFFSCIIQCTVPLFPFKRQLNRRAYKGEMENAIEGMRNWEENTRLKSVANAAFFKQAVN